MLQKPLIVALALSCFASLPATAQVPPSAERAARYTGLLAAAHRGELARIRALLAQKAPVDARDEQQRTPLHVATYAASARRSGCWRRPGPISTHSNFSATIR